MPYMNNPPYYLTAYGIAVKHGFVGSETKWLESLKGDPGEDLKIERSFDSYAQMTTYYASTKPDGFVKVGNQNSYLLYYWDSVNESWKSIALRGPQGEKGDTSPAAVAVQEDEPGDEVTVWIDTSGSESIRLGEVASHDVVPISMGGTGVTSVPQYLEELLGSQDSDGNMLMRIKVIEEWDADDSYSFWFEPPFFGLIVASHTQDNDGTTVPANAALYEIFAPSSCNPGKALIDRLSYSIDEKMSLSITADSTKTVVTLTTTSTSYARVMAIIPIIGECFDYESE